jgi:YD repeat-containing protein
MRCARTHVGHASGSSLVMARMLTSTREDGSVERFQFDDFGRTTAIFAPGDGTTPTIAAEYEALAPRCARGHAVITNEWDRERITHVIYPPLPLPGGPVTWLRARQARLLASRRADRRHPRRAARTRAPPRAPAAHPCGRPSPDAAGASWRPPHCAR